MSYLIDPSAAALAIQAKCGGSVAADNEGLLAVLDYLLPRVEDLMNVASLTYGQTTDSFTLDEVVPRHDAHKPVRLRLSNGYLVNSEDAPITITDPTGTVLTADDYTADLRLGVILLPVWVAGDYTISYYAGFTATDADEDATPVVHSVFEDVPIWINGVVVTLLTTWYRMMPKSLVIPEGVAYADLMNALYSELAARIRMRYMRPRTGMQFAVNSTRADGMLV
jgi:hypothetical protein